MRVAVQASAPRGQQTHQAAQQGGFTFAVGAEQKPELPPFDAEIHVLKDGFPAIAHAEVLGVEQGVHRVSAGRVRPARSAIIPQRLARRAAAASFTL